jgi:hypothetical protein
MAREHQILDPHKIDDCRWWYEEPEGIHVIAEVSTPDGNWNGTTQVLIPWKDIRAALEQKDRKASSSTKGKP